MIDHQNDRGEKSPRAMPSGLFRRDNDLNIPSWTRSIFLSFAGPFSCRVTDADDLAEPRGPRAVPVRRRRGGVALDRRRDGVGAPGRRPESRRRERRWTRGRALTELPRPRRAPYPQRGSRNRLRIGNGGAGRRVRLPAGVLARYRQICGTCGVESRETR